jgi:hypothetical protein
MLPRIQLRIQRAHEHTQQANRDRHREEEAGPAQTAPEVGEVSAGGAVVKPEIHESEGDDAHDAEDDVYCVLYVTNINMG